MLQFPGWSKPGTAWREFRTAAIAASTAANIAESRRQEAERAAGASVVCRVSRPRLRAASMLLLVVVVVSPAACCKS